MTREQKGDFVRRLQELEIQITKESIPRYAELLKDVPRKDLCGLVIAMIITCEETGAKFPKAYVIAVTNRINSFKELDDDEISVLEELFKRK